MKRRDFIRNAGTTSLMVPFAINGMNASVIPQTSLLNEIDAANDRVLVIVQLLGGNDGLNTVVPLNQYANLQKARPNVVLPLNSLINVTPAVGFHPVMTGMKQMYDNASLGIVQSVGYADQNRSHFRSVDIWRTGADSKEILTSGWAGRYFDTQYPGFPEGFPSAAHPHPIAVAMGSFVSETCQGRVANYSLALNDPFSFAQVYQGTNTPLPAGNYGIELDFMRDAITNSNGYASVISSAAKAGKNMVTYPDTSLAQQLKNVAVMISGGLKTRIYVVTQDNFDTHANQVQGGNTTLGTHANLLKNVSDALNAFQNDLIAQGLQNRVVGVSLSEFGRQIKSNGSNGTDHGSAAPLFLFGTCVKPQILGNNPVIPATVPDQAGVDLQFDFRDIYGSLLQDWFGANLATIQKVFHPAYKYYELISPSCKLAGRSMNRAAEEEPSADDGLAVFPNPSTGFSTLDLNLQSADHIQVGLYDSNGNQIRVLRSGVLEAGRHRIGVDITSLRPGNYFIRVTSGNSEKKVKMIVKM